MRSPLQYGAFLVLVACGIASADTITFKNGRRIEGRILSQSPTQVTVEVPGGQMDLPRAQIASIEERLTLEDDYAQRYAKVDPQDEEALHGLAAWARRHNLEARAQVLEEHARGVRLEKRFARAKTVSELLDLASWAKAQGYSTDVRRLAVARALQLEPRNATARRELALIRDEDRRAVEDEHLRELADREKALAERERVVALRERAVREKSAASRERLKPGGETPPAAEPPVGEESLPEPPSGQPPSDPAGQGAGPTPPPQITYLLVRRGVKRRPNTLDDDDDPTTPPRPQQGGGGTARPGQPAAPAPTPAQSAFLQGRPSAPSVSPNPLPAAPQTPGNQINGR